MSTDQHPAPPAEHGPSTEVRDLPQAHPAPLLGVRALLRDAEGLLLVVDRGGQSGWDLPGGPVGSELPTVALARHLRDTVGVETETGRLLAVDTVPASRPLLDLLFAAHVSSASPTAAETEGARWVDQAQALQLLEPAAAARLRAAFDAEQGAHTALLHDSAPVTPSTRDYYRQLPSPMAAATVLVRDTSGRILVLEPTYKQHWELVGGMIEAGESPAEAGAREVQEEIGLDLQVGRLLAVDTAPGRLVRSGRARIVHVHALEPLTPDQVDAVVLDPKEVRSARWLTPAEAAGLLPRILAERVSAALRALERGTVEVLDRTDTVTPADPGRGDPR
ncbi:NUDIX domain-containing protein [Kitasatospora sp. NPDC088783]|uniref:NUDIX domain-containing protein n=1 Tax=Kitasatospora sp. NPDC088783 TaxID=3364077 RepID=UPI00382FDA75